MTLAYAFWHVPVGEAPSYESDLVGFHAALAADRPHGFVTSWTWRLAAPPWFSPAPGVYLDWYLVEDFAALGTLNDAAVRGSRRTPHDSVARLARAGTGGVYRLLAGPAEPAPDLTFLDKPRKEPYETARARLAATGAAVWMRQMTLGPGPEFVVNAGSSPDVPWDGHRAEAVILR